MEQSHTPSHSDYERTDLVHPGPVEIEEDVGASDSSSMFKFCDRWNNTESDSENRRKTSRAMNFAVLEVIGDKSIAQSSGQVI